MSADPAEQCIRELEKENAELKHVNEILQEALDFSHNAERSKGSSALSSSSSKNIMVNGL